MGSKVQQLSQHIDKADRELLDSLRDLPAAVKVHAAAVDHLATAIQGVPESAGHELRAAQERIGSAVGVAVVVCLLVGGFVGYLFGKGKR